MKRLWRDICNLRFALLGIGVYTLTVHLVFGAFCPMQILTGFPCPGCGMTRALILVLQGHFAKAFLLQPPVYAWMFLGAWFAWNRYVRGRETSDSWRAVLVVTSLSTLAVYGWRLFHGFPAQLL